MALLEGKKVLVTGALGTIGQALVTRLAQEGAAVFALDRPDVPESTAILDQLVSGARFVGCDLNDLQATEDVATALAEEIGGIDILINNAAFVQNRPFEEFSIAEYEEEVRINSSAAFVLMRVVSGHMKRQRAGKIVNLTSMTLTGHWEGFVPYIASKGAMLGLIKGFARELGPFGINVNGISPGAVVSDAEYRHFSDRREEYHRWILERQSLKRRIEPVDIANLAVFLCSEQAALISGQNIECNGGW